MAQSLSKVVVHFVFSTKDRFPFLKGKSIRSGMHAYLGRIFKEYDSVAIEVGGTADHVHILCFLGRNVSMSELACKAKANSSAWVKRLGGMMAKFEWQGGYGAFSVHVSQIDRVREYIRGQEEHHRVRTFQEEYLCMLQEYGVEYDERYLWK